MESSSYPGHQPIPSHMGRDDPGIQIIPSHDVLKVLPQRRLVVGSVSQGVWGVKGVCALWHTLETNLRNEGRISVDRSTKTTLTRTIPCSSCKSYTKDLTQPTFKISIQQHAIWEQSRNYKIHIHEGISTHMILAEVDIIASAWILT